MVNYREIYTGGGDYLKGEDLKGCDPVEVEIENVELVKLGQDEKICLTFVGADKKLTLNATNARRIEAITGSPDTDDWIGHKITIHHELVEYAGKMVDGIRVMIPVKKTGKKASLTSKPITAAHAHNAPKDAGDDIPF